MTERRLVHEVAAPVVTNLVPEDFYKITYTGLTLDEAAIEVGGYFFLVLIAMMFMLDRLNGKFGNLNDWLLTRKLEVFHYESRNPTGVVFLLKFASMFYILLPIIVLVLWVILIGYSNMKDGLTLLSPVCILVVGVTAILFCVGLLKIKWNNYRFKKFALVCLVLALVLMTSYQGLIIFGFNFTEKFFPYSVFFLNFNVIILAVLIFLSHSNIHGEVSNMITQAFPPKG
jgi:hypothetical protein